LVSKSSQNYASKLHFTTLFNNSGDLDYPQDLQRLMDLVASNSVN
jgi:hypothetical protein